MEDDSWGSLEQSMASRHKLGRQSKDLGKRNRSDPSHSVGCCSGVIWLAVSFARTNSRVRQAHRKKRSHTVSI